MVYQTNVEEWGIVTPDKDFKPISEVGIEMFAGTTVNAPSFFFIQFNFFF